MDMDWKIAVAAIVGLSVVASSLVFSGTDMLSGLFSLSSGGSSGREVSISADLDLNEFTLELAGTSATEMKFDQGSVSIQVGKQKFAPAGKDFEIFLSDFNGKIVSYNGLYFDGTAREIDIGGYVKTQEKYPVSVGSQNFQLVRVSNVSIKSFTHVASGTVDVSYGKTTTTVRLNRDTLTLGGFSGSLEFANGRMYITGLAQKVVAANKINVG